MGPVKSSLVTLAVLMGFVGPVAAENFTTAAEVKPILQATKPQWVAVRLYDGKDLLYFTNLLSWRCGLSDIRYAVNGGEMARFEAEPCYENTGQPNALRAENLEAILVRFPPNSIDSVDVEIVFDDGAVETAHYARAAVEIQ